MLLVELFDDGRSDFKIKFGATVGPTGTSETELWIKITALHRRASESMDQRTREWFETTVERIQLLDSQFLTRF